MSSFSVCPAFDNARGNTLSVSNFYAIIAFYLSIYLALPATGEAAVSGAAADLPQLPPAIAEQASAVSSEMPKNQEEAISAISGSRWPGVIDHLLQRPLPDAGDSDSAADIHINYPSIGHKSVDVDIRSWVEGIADAFESHLDLASAPYDLVAPDDIDIFLHDDDLNSDYAASSNMQPQKFELWGSYKISRPSESAVSVTFEIWNYTNPEQGNLDILTLNYSLLNGQRLNFVDIFEKPEVALNLMSAWSRRQLEPRLGALRRARMLQEGTEPLVENFTNITLTPDGIQINFQPYQVAPWDAGIQKVDMPLEELMPSAPLLALWGKSGDNS